MDWFFVSLPETGYREALRLQQEIVAALQTRRLWGGVVLWVEHPGVFTMGRHAKPSSLKVSADFLEKRKIPVVPVERGGDITYHGPGQLIGYPIFNLRAMRLGVPDYIHLLEEVMIQTGTDFFAAPTRYRVNPGVWVGEQKLGSVGIALRRGICFHGFALNYALDLEPFDWIDPCGLSGVRMTSLENCIGIRLDRKTVEKSAGRHFENLFDIRPYQVPLGELISTWRAV